MREYTLNLAGRVYAFRFQDGELYTRSASELADGEWQRCARINLPCGQSVTDEQIRECILHKYQVHPQDL